MSVAPSQVAMGERVVSLAEELKPLMIFARAMGVAPYTNKNNIYKISLTAFFYTIILNIANFIAVFIRIHELGKAHNIKMSRLTGGRVVLTFIPIILNTFYAFLNRRESCELFKIVNKFDASINLKPGTKKHFAIIWAYMLLSISMVAVICCVSIMSTDSAVVNIIKLNGLLMFARNTASIGFFVTMLCSMLRRFDEINRIIEQNSKDLDMSDMVLRNSIGLRKVWILYDQLMEATEKLNSIYSAELLTWILTTSFMLIRHLHIEFNRDELKPLHTVMNGIFIAIYVLTLLFLTWFCHQTASVANDVASNAFHINTRVKQLNRSWDNEDTFVMAQYFVVRSPLQITAGGGLLRVNLPLLRTIVTTITTFLVILRSAGEKRQRA